MPHLLILAGPPQTGVWWCARCGDSFEFFTDTRSPCRRWRFAWSADRVARFHANAHPKSDR